MTEIFSPNVELPKPPEAIGQAELEEVLRRARAPIIREGFAEPWAGDPATFDPAQAGWEQAGQNLLGQIDRMRSSGLVQLTPEGLTPKQAAEKAGESAKLAEADKRAAELAEQLRQRQAAVPGQRPPVEAPPSPREQWNQPPAEAEEPADEPEEEEVEGQVKSGLSKFLESVPWKRIALEGATVVPPLIFGGTLGYFSPETARNISVAVGSAGVGLAFTSMAAAMAERILPVHIRAGRLGKALVAAKVGGLYGGNVLLSTAIGTHIGAGIRAGIEALQAAAQQAAGGEGGAGWEGITDRGADRGIDTGDLRQRPEAPVVSVPSGREAPVLSASEGEFVNRAGEVAAQEAQEMADAAQGAAEHQRAVEAALTPQQLTGAELTGGTVWGHEEAFVGGLRNVAHPNVATNALKNLAYGLEQGQEFTKIGPTDVVNLVNQDVGAKIAEAASNIVGREPSTLTGVDKMLWELGVLGEHATRAVAETVIKAFANK